MNSIKKIYNSLNHRILYQTLKPLLEKIEIKYGYLLTPELTEILPKTLPKIALVKQDVYQDLYCCPPNSSAKEIILSTFMRSGFVGLFTKLNADFFIIKTELDPECNIWQQKCYDCHQKPVEFYESLKEKHALYSKSASEIDWSIYDIVINLDIAIPSRITKQYPQVVWCYCPGESCMSCYQQSKQKIIDGYDLFISQQFRHFPIIPPVANHELEFPYYLQYYGCFNNLIDAELLNIKKEGIFIEFNWRNVLIDKQKEILEKFGTIRCPKGIKNILTDLAKSKYFIIGEGTRGLWGNAMIEAIASGCLLLGNPFYVKHKSLFTPDTVVYNFEELIAKLNYFENHEEIYLRELEKQRKLLNYICFYRPLKDLLTKAQKVLKSRNQNINFAC